jgi:class 3 adenylate cyclase
MGVSRSFEEVERDLLARRWQRVAPLAMVLAALAEVAAWLTPEFPKAPVMTGLMLLVLGATWAVARWTPTRAALVLGNVAVGIMAAVYAADAAAQTGRFASLHVMAVPCIFAFMTALLAIGPLEVAATMAAAIVAWVLVCYFARRAPGEVVSTDGLTTAVTYLVFLGAVTTSWVAYNRRLRRSELTTRQRLEEMHRFAVEEVLCRHLPPRYVERVLAGTHLLDGPPERRVVTVVFADIVSFTPLSDAMRPEDLAKLMARFYDVTSTIAFEHGATIDKFIGDAVMAIMGAPEPLDPAVQARRALDMALAWRRAVADILPGEDKLTLRIGIHQDAVAVGSFGGRHRTDYTVLGMGVNIAARLEQRCPPGRVLVSREVLDKLEPRPEGVEALGRLELKGVPRPVEAYAV